MSIVGGYHEYTGGVQYTGGISRVHWGDIMINVGEDHWEKQLNSYGNPSVLNISRCTHDILHTHHECPHGIPQCTEHPPLYS